MKYDAEPNKSKYGYEESFFRFIKRLHDDVQRKIKKNMDRLELVQPNGEVLETRRYFLEYFCPFYDAFFLLFFQVADLVKDQLETKAKALTNKIDEMVEQAEQLGASGKVDDSRKTIEYVEQLRTERQKTQVVSILLNLFRTCIHYYIYSLCIQTLELVF